MDAKRTVRRGVELWNARDREVFLALFDESVIWLDEASGQQLTGRDELGMGWYDAVMASYPDREVTDAVVFGEGELVCLQGRLVGTHTGSWHGPAGEIPPTGKRIDAPFAQVYEVRDGKVTRVWNYGDRLLMLEQEGIVSLEKLFAAGAA
ncbi:MAG TPA: nuclear transport factor 2 family protein [Solirubrobacteraceae bacterium]|nr:nuclear transport factor 2 family protein [Solirubrobacteraceae bacterium]